MVKNKTRQKPANAWVSLCLVTKRLANWGELLSGRPWVRIPPSAPFAAPKAQGTEGLSALFSLRMDPTGRGAMRIRGGNLPICPCRGLLCRRLQKALRKPAGSAAQAPGRPFSPVPAGSPWFFRQEIRKERPSQARGTSVPAAQAAMDEKSRPSVALLQDDRGPRVCFGRGLCAAARTYGV